MQTKRIVSLEDAGQTAKGTPYWKVTWDDGKFDNIFSQEFYDLLVEADDKKVAVNIEKEKSGKYWNVTNLTLAETPSANLSETPVETPKKSEPKFKADPDKTESIERQSALKSAIELVVSGKVEAEKVLSYAEVFRRFICGDITVSDEATFTELISKFFKIK